MIIVVLWVAIKRLKNNKKVNKEIQMYYKNLRHFPFNILKKYTKQLYALGLDICPRKKSGNFTNQKNLVNKLDEREGNR